MPSVRPHCVRRTNEPIVSLRQTGRSDCLQHFGVVLAFFTCAPACIAEDFKSAFRCQDAVALKMELLFYERICYVQEGSNSLVHHPHT